jgi:hypothetical protein
MDGIPALIRKNLDTYSAVRVLENLGDSVNPTLADMRKTASLKLLALSHLYDAKKKYEAVLNPCRIQLIGFAGILLQQSRTTPCCCLGN